MIVRKLLAGAACAVLAAGLSVCLSAPAMAFGVQKVTEDSVTGYVGDIPLSGPPVTVGSDGEAPFDPFGAGYDTSDGIVLNDGWSPDPAYAAAFAPGYWTQLPGTFTWVLPACNSSGCENANIVEPIAKWDFAGGGWEAGTMSVEMFEADGVTLSDIVKVANDGPNGGATITFFSGTPEPATWAMMLMGVAGLGAVLRNSRRKALDAVASA
jgi:hypothetical protein